MKHKEIMSSFDFEKWSKAKSLCDQLPDICSRRMKNIDLFRTLFDYPSDSWAIEIGDPEFPIVHKIGFKTSNEADEALSQIMKKFVNAPNGNVEEIFKELVTTR